MPDEMNFDKAEAEIEKAIKANPDKSELYMLQGSFLAGQGKNEPAEQSYLKAVEIDPENIRTLMALAAFYDTTDKKDKAREVYQKALERHPNDFTVKQALAQFYFKNHQNEKAEKLVAEILEERPNYLPTRMLKGEMLVAQRRFDEAVDLFAELIKEEPQAARPYYFRGLAYLGSGQTAAGKMDIARTVELEPGFTQARLLLADLYLRERAFELARKESEEILAKDPANLAAMLIRGNALMYQRQAGSRPESFRGGHPHGS